MADRHHLPWLLYRGDELVAELFVTGGDLPWLNARLVAREGFAQVRELFDEELRLVENIDDDCDAWATAYEAIRATLTLRYPDGREVPEFLLHVRDDEAWWRWHDEPFKDGAGHGGGGPATHPAQR